jgi:hypothetical protein
MSSYRHYRRPYYHRGYRDHGRSFELLKALFVLGGAFILLGSMSSTINVGKIASVFGAILLWGLLLLAAFFVFRKIRNKSRLSLYVEDSSVEKYKDSKNLSTINSEKHGCKCYMDDLTDGEIEVARILSEGLSYKDYFIFNNLMVPSERNGSSQIDHLVVSKFGVFVIESKDFSGWIFGSREQENWTQSLPGGVDRFQFQNPIRQNWSHVMALRALLPFLSEATFHSIVVFTEKGEIKTPRIEGVVMAGDLVATITKNAEIKMSDDGLHMAIGKLSYLCQAADISFSDHLGNLQSRHPVKVVDQT